MTKPTANQYVTLATTAPRLRVRALRGETGPIITGGYGGWQEIARPRRKSLTIFQGHSPYRMQLPLLLDAFATGGTLENDISQLERMGRLPAANTPPPIIHLSGHVPHQELAWVIDTDGLDWGDAIWHRKGYRTRQAVTVTLLEHVTAGQVAELTAAERARIEAGAKSGVTTRMVTTVRAREGDTLLTIADREFGDYKRWRDLSRINSIRDPDNVRTGQEIRLS